MSDVENYIQSRILPRLKYYDSRAKRYKFISRGARFISSFLSISILFMINFDSIPKSIISLIAGLVVLIISVESVGQFDSLWRSYRLTYEMLETERYLSLSLWTV